MFIKDMAGLIIKHRDKIIGLLLLLYLSINNR